MEMAPGSGHAATQPPQPTHMSPRTTARSGASSVTALSAGRAIGADTTSNACCGTPHFGHVSAPAAISVSQRLHRDGPRGFAALAGELVRLTCR